MKKQDMASEYDRIRKIRNGINYYGKKVSIEDAKLLIEDIKKLIKECSEILEL